MDKENKKEMDAPVIRPDEKALPKQSTSDLIKDVFPEEEIARRVESFKDWLSRFLKIRLS